MNTDTTILKEMKKFLANGPGDLHPSPRFRKTVPIRARRHVSMLVLPCTANPASGIMALACRSN